MISKWVGESERAVREIFKSLQSSPSIIFLDEFESIANMRNSNSMKVVTFLIELLISC